MYAHNNHSGNSAKRETTNRENEAGRHMEQINAVVSGITEMDIFLGYDCIEVLNSEVIC